RRARPASAPGPPADYLVLGFFERCHRFGRCHGGHLSQKLVRSAAPPYAISIPAHRLRVRNIRMRNIEMLRRRSMITSAPRAGKPGSHVPGEDGTGGKVSARRAKL